MAALDIPEQYLDGVALIGGLNDEAFNELLSALETAPLAFRHRLFASNVAAEVKSISKADISQIVEMLISMNIVRRSASVEISEFINDVYDAVVDIGDEEFDSIVEQEDQFKTKLSRLLSSKSLEIVSKAQSVILDHERRFCSVRVASSISPVFGSDAEQPPLAAVITHTLRISYHQESNDIKEFFVELSEKDLKKLSHSIKRAGQKAKALKAILDNGKLPNLEW